MSSGSTVNGEGVFGADALRAFCEEVFLSCEMAPEDAAIVADSLVVTDKIFGAVYNSYDDSLVGISGYRFGSPCLCTRYCQHAGFAGGTCESSEFVEE